jgi:hypothetical protein
MFAPPRCLVAVLSYCGKIPPQIDPCACLLVDTRHEDSQPTALIGGYRSCKCQKSSACGQEAARKESPIYAEAVDIRRADRAEKTIVPFRDGENF